MPNHADVDTWEGEKPLRGVGVGRLFESDAPRQVGRGSGVSDELRHSSVHLQVLDDFAAGDQPSAALAVTAARGEPAIAQFVGKLVAG